MSFNLAIFTVNRSRNFGSVCLRVKKAKIGQKRALFRPVFRGFSPVDRKIDFYVYYG